VKAIVRFFVLRSLNGKDSKKKVHNVGSAHEPKELLPVRVNVFPRPQKEPLTTWGVSQKQPKGDETIEEAVTWESGTLCLGGGVEVPKAEQDSETCSQRGRKMLRRTERGETRKSFVG